MIKLIGKKFGKLLVLGNNTKRGYHPYVECVCDCGKKKSICIYNLIKGKSKSCGCVCGSGPRHGMAKTNQYQTRSEMKRRCNSKSKKGYQYYGGRGISYDKKWEQFEGFWEDMGNTYVSGLSLERINVNGNYCKDNCKWIPIEDQAKNKRNTRFETYNGKTKRTKERAKEFGLSYVRLTRRLYMGWGIKRALETPINTSKINKRYIDFKNNQ